MATQTHSPALRALGQDPTFGPGSGPASGAVSSRLPPEGPRALLPQPQCELLLSSLCFTVTCLGGARALRPTWGSVGWGLGAVVEWVLVGSRDARPLEAVPCLAEGDKEGHLHEDKSGDGLPHICPPQP